MKSDVLADTCWAAALATLPLVGVGLSRAVGGPELATGLLPAYLLVAAAWSFRLAARAGRRVTSRPGRSPSGPGQRAVWTVAAAILLAVLVSGLGLRLAPAPVVAHEAWPRFGKQVVQLVLMLAFTVYAALWTRGPARWRATVNWLAVGLVIELVYAPLQAWHALGGVGWLRPVEALATSNPGILSGSSWLYLGGFTAIPRLRGTMCEPLYLGSFLVAVVPLLMAAGRGRLAAGGVLLLAATWSRGAWLALLAGAVVWMVLRRRAGLVVLARRWWLGLATTVAVVAALALVAGGPELLWLPLRRLGQTLDPADWSNLTRIYSLQAAWRAFELSPIVGVGWGQFAYHFYALVDVSGLQSQFTWPVVNSLPLLVLSETGLVGFGVLTAALVWAWRATWRQLVRIRDGRRPRLAAVAAAMAAVSLHLCLFSQYNLPHLWVLPGLWLAAISEPEALRCCRGGPVVRRPLVVLDALLLRPQPTGVGRSILDWTAALAANDHGLDVVVLATHPELLGHLASAPGWRLLECPGARGGTLRKAIWTQCRLPGLLKRLGADLLHTFQFVAPLSAPCPMVVTVHDLGYRHFPDTIEQPRRAYYEFFVPRSLARAAAVVCNSQTTAEDVRATFPAVSVPVIATPFGRPSWVAGRPVPLPERADDAPFLFVGTLEPRKNLQALLQAYAVFRGERERSGRPAPGLHLVGGRGWRDSGIREVMEPLERAGHVTVLDYCGPDELWRGIRVGAGLAVP